LSRIGFRVEQSTETGQFPDEQVGVTSKIGQRVGTVPIDLQLLDYAELGQFGEPGCQEIGCNAEAFVQLLEARRTGV
jgi:hypothetical protein